MCADHTASVSKHRRRKVETAKIYSFPSALLVVICVWTQEMDVAIAYLERFTALTLYFGPIRGLCVKFINSSITCKPTISAHTHTHTARYIF